MNPLRLDVKKRVRIDLDGIHQILYKVRKKKINSQKYFVMISEKKRVDVGATISIISEKEKNTTRRDKKLLENEKKEVTDRPAVNFYEMNKKIK